MNRNLYRAKFTPCDCKEFGDSECECEEFHNFPEEFYKDGFVYGQLVADDIIASGVVETHDSAIVYEYWARIDEKTKGQHIGINDENDKPMFEDDIIDLEEDGIVGLIRYDHHKLRYVIDLYGIDEFWNGLYDETRTGFIDTMEFDDYLYDDKFCFTVIGNRHDNSELLEIA